MNETQTIAKYVAELKYASIPQSILQEVKIFLFDYLGVALGGSQTKGGKIAAEFSRSGDVRLVDAEKVQSGTCRLKRRGFRHSGPDGIYRRRDDSGRGARIS